MKRPDDYLQRRAHLADLSDDQLHQRFWDLVKQLTDPLLQAGREYTSPAIERSVLLRMGFDSLEAQAIVNRCQERDLLCHGAGHVVYKLSQLKQVPVRYAGLRLMEGDLLEEAAQLFDQEDNP